MIFLWKQINSIDTGSGRDSGGSACLPALYFAKKAYTSNGDGESLYSPKLDDHATAVIGLLHYSQETPFPGP